MTTDQKVARRKLSMLQLASELNNVSKACRLMGYSRQQFYEIRRNYQTYGADGLIDRLPGARGPHPNRVAPEVEQAILDHCLDHPSHGALRVAQELMLKGVQVSSGGVRGVWSRHGLLTKQERLLRLEQATAQRKITLTDEQIRLLERFSPEFRERHIEARHTGDLVAVDTFPWVRPWAGPRTCFVGTLKGVGKVYLQSAIDCHSRYAWGRLYPNKMPVTAVHLLNTDVLPTFEHTARASPRCSPITAGSSAAGPTGTLMSCSSSSRRSSTAPQRSSARNPTALSSACTEPCSTSTSASWAARNGTRPSTRCRPTSTPTSPSTTPSDPTRAEA